MCVRIYRVSLAVTLGPARVLSPNQAVPMFGHLKNRQLMRAFPSCISELEFLNYFSVFVVYCVSSRSHYKTSIRFTILPPSIWTRAITVKGNDRSPRMLFTPISLEQFPYTLPRLDFFFAENITYCDTAKSTYYSSFRQRIPQPTKNAHRNCASSRNEYVTQSHSQAQFVLPRSLEFAETNVRRRLLSTEDSILGSSLVGDGILRQVPRIQRRAQTARGPHEPQDNAKRSEGG